MSYSLALNGGGSGEEGVVRKLAAGQMVTVRLQPHGLNTSNQGPVFAELDRAMASLDIFRAVDYRGWGGGTRTPDSAGMVVYIAPMKTSQYTAKQVADLANSAVKRVEQALGVKRLSLVTIKHPRATGDIVQSAPPPAPDGGGLPVPETPAPSGGGSSYEESSEQPNFFTKKIGPVPVWALGAGVLVLGAGLVFFAVSKKPMARNASRRVRRNAGSDPLDGDDDALDLPSEGTKLPRRFSRKPGSEGYERDRHYMGITDRESVALRALRGRTRGLKRNVSRSSRALRANGKKWYILRVPTGQERKVMIALRNQMVARDLSPMFGQMLSPEKISTETFLDYTDPKRPVEQKRIRRDAMYPGYIYIQIESPIDLGVRYMLQSTPGVIEILGGKFPTVVPEAQIAKVLEVAGVELPEPAAPTPIKAGDRVKVIRGGFSGMGAKVERLIPGTTKARVLIDGYGEPTVVRLDLSDIERV